MIFSRAWFALMRRNMVYFRRNWFSTIMEIILPAFFVWVLVAIKNSGGGDETDIVEANIPTENDGFVAPTFRDYVTAMQVERKCVLSSNGFQISGMNRDSYNWQIPFVKCDSTECSSDDQDAQKFCTYSFMAVSGSSASDEGGKQRALDFKNWIEKKYPAILDKQLMPFDFDLIQVMDDPDAMSSYVKRSGYGESVDIPPMVMGVVFDGNDQTDFKYWLRQNSTNYNSLELRDREGTTTTPDTARKFATYARSDSQCTTLDGTTYLGSDEFSCSRQYAFNGILTFQRLVGDFIMDRTGAAERGYFVSEGGVAFVPFPTPAYEDDGFFADIEDFVGLIVTLGLLYPLSSMISYIVTEKQLRQKELMKMMSVNESDIGWSWFMTFLTQHFFTATLTTIFSTRLYDDSDSFYLWVFWLFSFLSIIVFVMVIASLTSKTTRGVLIGLLVFFIGSFLPSAVSYEDSDSGTLFLVSLHPVCAFTYGLMELGRLEDNGVGLNSNTIDVTDNPSGYTFSNSLSNLISASIILGILSWYLNRVIRPDYGQALPLTFPFSPLYWGCGSAPKEENIDEEEYEDEVPLEPVSDALKRQAQEGKSIEIKKLRKVFGDKTAVSGLSLSMYNGEITALLGHNGAGKTTTISMLTGALAPTSGYAMVAGKDIRTQLQDIRQDIGICLQHDCLFPNLTVREHVQFFARLKGLYTTMSKEEAEAQIDQTILDVALGEKRNTFSRNLSGGMKRKLSVAIAFCGGSKVVLLDEPTSGMDPFSRRFTWNVIRQYRHNRCIILTTHFMDEADILGDRIAIMADGRLRCAGSSLFLKKTYGVGYQLVIEKNHDKSAAEKSKDTETLKAIVAKNVPEASLLNNVGTEISYQLPMAASPKFPPMFEGLDNEIDNGAVSSYGVSLTTLEEVFLLVARGDVMKKGEYASSSMHLNSAGDGLNNTAHSRQSRMNLEKEGLFLRHMGALFRKRASNFRRDKVAWCCTTVLPSIFVLFGFMIFKLAAEQRNLDPIVLDFNVYNSGLKNTELRNPIAFNDPGVFRCQVGNCINYPKVADPDSTYEYCGFSGRDRTTGDSSCSIESSTAVASRLVDDGASAFGVTADGIEATSSQILDASNNLRASQYGAIFYTHEASSVISANSSAYAGLPYNDTAIGICVEKAVDYMSAEECQDFGGYGYVIQYNFTSIHVAPMFQTLADEALVRHATNNPTFNIECTIAPLPITEVEEGIGESDDAFSSWFLVVLSFPFIGGAYGGFVVNERESKAKHLQTVAGVKPGAYWLSTWLWDIMNYQFPLWITVMLMFAFDVGVLTTTKDNVLSGVIALLFFFGPASAGLTYCVSFAFTSASLCSVFVIISGFLIGMGGPLTMFILLIIAEDNQDPNDNLKRIRDILTWILRIFFPAFNLGNGLLNAIYITFLQFYTENEDLSAWSTDVLGLEVLFLGIQGAVYTFLAIMIDIWSTNPRTVSMFKLLTCQFLCAAPQNRNAGDITMAIPDDDDVLAEQERVLAGEANSDNIVLHELTKVYDNGKVAVNKLSLGIPAGQVFGLLGINGAGKTTTMQMLTAEFPPTSGDATLAGHSVVNEPEKTRRRIGYCPQFDAHFNNMTGREHVELYASVKGVPLASVKEAAANKLKEVGLSEKDADRLAAGYSGGMKRRLSLACATIGQPQIVFLDECSTGVDPVARREIWQMVSDLVAGGDDIADEERTSVILTTHSMEECEALCPRIGIMANGRLRCLGSAQHLKNKFGQGYQLEMKVSNLNKEDDDYAQTMELLASNKGNESEAFSLEEVVRVLQAITGDDYLSSMVTASNPLGYDVWKDASSPLGVSVESLTTFTAIELRMKKLADFMAQHYPRNVLRERQDTKVRFEISSEGVRIAQIFANLEENKEDLRLSEYGVSQTSLEQVFNMHAAEAERLKQGRNDG